MFTQVSSLRRAASRGHRSVLPLLGLLAMGCFQAAGRARAAERPNIIFILCDDLGYGDVQCLNPERGKIATPQLDRFASQGMTFTDAHSTSAVCTPSRYSILTGRYNWRTHLQASVFNGYNLPLIAPNRLTVGALLKQHGYATACFGKWHLGMGISKDNPDAPITDGPTTRGFDHFFGISASADMPPYAFIEDDHYAEKPTETKELYRGRKGPGAPGFEIEKILPTLARKSCEWIDAHAHQDKPFFLYLALNSPHTPLNPTQEWRGKSGLGSYADYVMETDWAVGQVFAQLDKSGVAGNTLIFFTSDNGCAPYIGTSCEVDPMPHKMGDVKQLEARGHFPSQNRRGYKADIWDGGHRIPLLVRWPGKVKAGSTCDQLVSLVDFMGTCANLLDAKLPEDAGEDTVSLLPALLGTATAPLHEAVVFHSVNGTFAIQQGPWKLDLCPSSGGWSAPTPNSKEARSLPAVQLYDMDRDVGESANAQKEHPEIVERLTKLLQKYVAEGRSTPGAP